MTKKPKISAEVGAEEFEGFKKAADAKGVTLSEWIRTKLSAPETPEVPPEAPPAPPEAPPQPPPPPPQPLLETTSATLPPEWSEPAASVPAIVAAPPLPKNPLPAHLAATVSVAQKRAMLFESPNALPPYRPPEGREGPAAKPLVASHPTTLPPKPAVRTEAAQLPNALVQAAMAVNEHPCIHLKPGTPANLRAGECFGLCGNNSQLGKPCFWGPAVAGKCVVFHPKVAQVMSNGARTPQFPRR